MKTKKYMTMVLFIGISGILVTSGCANRQNREPDIIVDMKGVDAAQYQADLLECQQYANQVQQKVGSRAAGGAIGGALIGAAIGNRDTAKKLAGVGAVSGAGKGAEETQVEKKAVIRNCLIGRGYNVLN